MSQWCQEPSVGRVWRRGVVARRRRREVSAALVVGGVGMAATIAALAGLGIHESHADAVFVSGAASFAAGVSGQRRTARRSVGIGAELRSGLGATPATPPDTLRATRPDSSDG